MEKENFWLFIWIHFLNTFPSLDSIFHISEKKRNPDTGLSYPDVADIKRKKVNENW